MTRREGLIGVGLLALAGCDPQRLLDIDGDPVAATQGAADRLLKQTELRLPRTTPILVASLTPVDQVAETSRFGELIADLTANALVQRGQRVMEGLLRNAYLVGPRGVFVLSDQVAELAATQQAEAVLTGTYAAAADDVVVALKVIAVATADVIAADQFTLPMGPDTRALVYAPVGIDPNQPLPPRFAFTRAR